MPFRLLLSLHFFVAVWGIFFLFVFVCGYIFILFFKRLDQDKVWKRKKKSIEL